MQPDKIREKIDKAPDKEVDSSGKKFVEKEEKNQNFYFIVCLAVFIIIQALFFAYATNWSSPLVVGIMKIIALIVLFPKVKVVFQEIVNVLKGHLDSKKTTEDDKPSAKLEKSS